jgi:hypothetical protein
MTVIGLADQLHDASAVARTGAMKIAEACRLVLRTVDAAEREGFTVGEDFSVTDHHVYNARARAARQAQAMAFAADLRATLADLVATDVQVASQITAATAGLGKDPFAESGGDSAPHDASAADQLLAKEATGKGIKDGGLSAGNPLSTLPAATGAAAESGAETEPLFTPGDWAWSAAGMGVSAKTEIPGYFVERAMKDTPKGAPGSWTKSAFSDIERVPFLKGVKPAGGVLGAVFMVPAVMADKAVDGNSTSQAIARETGGFLAGAATGAVVGTAIGGPVGTVAGIIIGGLVSTGTSKFIEKSWEPVGSFVENLFG